jgi:hypothetical protein
MINKWFLAAFGAALCSLALAWDPAPAFANTCKIGSETINKIQSKLLKVVTLPDQNGGLFTPNRMWLAVVDRTGKVCFVFAATPTLGPTAAPLPSPRPIPPTA